MKRSWILFSLLVMSCAPKIYFVDKPSLLQEEAAGEWPDVEASIRRRTLDPTPAMLKKIPESSAKKNAFAQIPSEYTSSESAAVEPKP